MPTADALDRLLPDDVAQVRDLVQVVSAADGVPPLSDHVMLHLPGGGDTSVTHLLVRDGGSLIGYAHLDVTDQVAGSSAELAVHPDRRGSGVGRLLAEELLRRSPDGRLRLWAHGDRPEAAKLADSLGFVRSRSLWRMERPLAEALPPVKIPEGVAVRTFVVGQDEAAWTALNNRAFAGHPEQGDWGLEEIEVREGEPWFDPEGFFLAFRGLGMEDLVGFHWTKIHGGHSHGDHAHDAVGEVYVVGVDPSEQGRGLGPALTLRGLHHLQDKGLPTVILYVDESNTRAIAVYEGLGFARVATDVSFAKLA
ncbi:MAG: mycothiol synthase [Frankiales bacterium]|nr:mycothiol synthase [Frankiales bacterium]